MLYKVPFNKPCIVGKELDYIAEAIREGNIGGDGLFTEKCSQLLGDRLGVRDVLMTPSCTAALEMAAILCDLGPGDEVIVPSYTFVSTVNAFFLRGAKPVFVDIRPETLTLDERAIEPALTSKTRAIFAVQYAGIACDMGSIMDIAQRHGLRVVEDAAQAVNAFYRGRPLGSIGHLGAFSFHESKNYTCGQGGALCVNDSELMERAEIVRQKGTDRSKFFRGEVDRYSWVDIGSSYVPNEISCAFLYGQLELLDEITERRRQIYETYLKHLKPFESRGLLRLARIPKDCRSNYHLFYILLPDEGIRAAVMNHLKRKGIPAFFHYTPLHLSPMGARLGYQKGDLPVTEEMSSCLLRLPIHYDLSEAEQQLVLDEIAESMRLV